jgi:hypothetical protein
MERRIHAYGARKDQTDQRDVLFFERELDGLPLVVDHSGLVLRILDQGREGSCTAQAVCLAAELLYRERGREARLSRRWIYRRARERDPWRGENYHGTTIRAALSGWADSGVPPESEWTYAPYEISDADPSFDLPSWENHDGPSATAPQRAREFPLLSYQRCTSLNAIKLALVARHVVLASAQAHSGWESNWGTPDIPFDDGVRSTMGHAFALVGFSETHRHFIVANSWGAEWGIGGFGNWSYVDAQANLWDAWSAVVPR